MIAALLLFLLSFVGSFIFAGFETGLVSINRLKVAHAASDNDHKAVQLLKLMSQQARVVSTVLVGNNIALVGMQSSFSALLLLFFTVSPVLETTLLTVIALIFCELLPKSLFRIYSYKMTYFFTPFIGFLNALFLPLTIVIDWISSIGGKSEDEPSEMLIAELTAIADEGGRKEELSLMIPELSKQLLPLESESVSEFLRQLSLSSVNSDSVTGSIVEISGGDSATKLLNPEFIFSGTLFSVEGRSVYRSEDLMKAILFANS
jgi:putative hemolysin